MRLILIVVLIFISLIICNFKQLPELLALRPPHSPSIGGAYGVRHCGFGPTEGETMLELSQG